MPGQYWSNRDRQTAVLFNTETIDARSERTLALSATEGRNWDTFHKSQSSSKDVQIAIADSVTVPPTPE